jgi:TatA/E family protein of Tat protein translocase
MLGGLSMTEIVIILALALLLLGPDQLPSLARSLGKGLRELRKATDDLKGQFEQEIARVDLDEQPQRMIAPVPPPAPDAPADPGAARAIARTAAGTGEVPPAAGTGEVAPEDPAAARAAARRHAAEIRAVPAEGAVPQEEKKT